MTASIVARGPQLLIVRRESWAPFYEAEQRELARVAGDLLLAFEHVGSTAVPGLPSKPVIDILAGARSLDDAGALAARLAALRYIQIPFRPANSDAVSTDRLFFLKRPLDASAGVDPDHPGCNIHVVAMERFAADEQLLLRDYLRAHPDVAAAYGRLKCEIAERIADYREYMPAKAAFIAGVLAEARRG
jgi:GrpB-like predicted nucleotidyltransferase (UPF0157 family)